MYLVPSHSRITIYSPAKLNLFLEVLGKRPDGYHDLDTVMLTVDLFDQIEFSAASQLKLSISKTTPGNLSETDNLVLKAALLLRNSVGRPDLGAAIHLAKRIPLEAGLAGGSSNAAATLLGLNQLWDLRLPIEQLRELGAALGSDVPFFLADSTAAVCRGRGELIEPIQVPGRLHFVIVKPARGLSTPAVFRGTTVVPNSEDSIAFRSALRAANWPRAGNRMWNRLQEAAETMLPELLEIKRAFSGFELWGHQMTGSGSSYFGWCPSRRAANHLAALLRNRRLGSVWAVSTTA